MRWLPAVTVLAACGGDPSSTRPDAASVVDAAVDAGPGSACTGACQVTSLTATMMATRTLDRAYYGVTAADGTLYVEAYAGGQTGCPEMTSPTPDYTLILGRVPPPASSGPLTSPATFIDFVGDMYATSPQPQTATAVTLSAVAFQPAMFIALDVTLTFPPGAVAGHLYATHCASLDS